MFFQNHKNNIFLSIGSILLILTISSSCRFAVPAAGVREETTATGVDQENDTAIFVPEPIQPTRVVEPTPTPVKIIPSKIVIKKIELEAPIIPVEQINVQIAEQNYAQFLVPEFFSVGWHTGSAPLGEVGNTVISGHHNSFGEVFKNLNELEVGDEIEIYGEGGEEFKYLVSNRLTLKEKGEPLEIRLENARWISPTKDKRLTIATCWPDDSNTHRLILVAVPAPENSPYDEHPTLPDVIANIDLKTPAAFHLRSQTATPPYMDLCIALNTTTSNINIRVSPSLNSKISGNLPAGDQAQCEGKTDDNEWIKVHYEGIEGWISSEIVTVHPDIDLLPNLADH